MHRIGACLAGGADVLGGVEVARDGERLVGASRVERPGVVGLGDRHRRDPERAARAEHAHRDLAAVRDQELAERT